MPLVKADEMLMHAYHNGYAVGAFDLLNLEVLKGILDASEATKSPVILSLSESDLSRDDMALLIPAMVAAARCATIPVAVHFDDGASTSSIVWAINSGCTSVMIRGDDFPLANHIEQSRELVCTAHGCGIPVEYLFGDLSAINKDNNGAYTAQIVKGFIQDTDIDFVGLSLEDIYGGCLPLNEMVLQKISHIKETIARPIVLHSNYGMAEEAYKTLIASGVAKINYHTALSDLVCEQLRQKVVMGLADYKTLYQGLAEIVSNEVARCQAMWGCAGVAEQVLQHCQTVREVEHLIIYNVDDDMAESKTMEMMTEGRKTLAAIPGVRRVFAGKAVNEEAAYLYCWLVRFSDEAVIASYRDHPDHVNFADTLFRPVAVNRISIDYEAIKDD